MLSNRKTNEDEQQRSECSFEFVNDLLNTCFKKVHNLFDV